MTESRGILRPIAAQAADGVPLAGVYVPGPGPAYVIAHGMTGNTDRPVVRAVIRGFAAHGAVVALDFRGHGRSGGTSSAGRDEHLDIDAAIAVARATGHRQVAVVGFSMGGAAAVRHAALGTNPPDVVIAVSAPSRWFIRNTPAMRRVHWLLESPLGRRAGRLIGIRIGEPWDVVPPTPLELAGQIAPIPLLLVHGTSDRYYNPGQSAGLQRASLGHGELWVEPGMGHAESATSVELIDRIAAWAAEHLGPLAVGHLSSAASGLAAQ